MKREIGRVLGVALIGICCVCGGTYADEFAVTISQFPPSVPLGIPIEVTVQARHTTGKPFRTIGLFKGYPSPDGFLSVFARARSESQRELGPCVFPWSIDDVHLGHGQQPPDWHQERRIPVCLGDPDQYSVRAVIAERNSVFKDMSPAAGGEEYPIWHGEVASREVGIDVTEPQGVDREAYERYKGQPMRAPELLREFPTSTYAAYVVWDMTGAKGAAQSDPAKVADALRYGLRAVARSVLCPPGAGCDPGKKLEGQNPADVAIDRTARWIDIVLKAHPEIWFADELRLRLALDEIASGESSRGVAAIAALSKSARPDIAEKANQLLVLIEQKGLAR